MRKRFCARAVASSEDPEISSIMSDSAWLNGYQHHLVCAFKVQDSMYICVCMCMHACVRACVCACVRVFVRSFARSFIASSSLPVLSRTSCSFWRCSFVRSFVRLFMAYTLFDGAILSRVLCYTMQRFLPLDMSVGTQWSKTMPLRSRFLLGHLLPQQHWPYMYRTAYFCTRLLAYTGKLWRYLSIYIYIFIYIPVPGLTLIYIYIYTS